MTDGWLMDANCIHGNSWYECETCEEELDKKMEEILNDLPDSRTEYEG